MENTEELANGGRVTRSLRKRLNSVDSDASSRPGTPTPVNKKLAPITETTALLTRAIRRNSTTTPVKTPLKPRATRGTTPDLNSPARRVTRRSSISFEDEHTTSNNKSIIKEPQFNALPEEEPKETTRMTIAQIKTPNVNSPARRNTRRTSVSFLEEDSPTTASSVTLINDSRFETLAEYKETIKASQDKKSAIPAKGAISNVEQLDVPPKRVTRSQSRSPEQVQEQIQSKRPLTRSKGVTDRYSKAEYSDIEIIDLETDDETTSDVNRVETLKPSKQPADQIIIDVSNDTPKSEEPTEKENIILREQQDAHNEPAPAPEPAPLGNKSVPIITELVYLENLTPMTIARYIDKNVAEADYSAQESKQMENIKSQLGTTKSVTFNDSEEEEDIKSTYPKTPALMKSRSYIGADCSKETQEQDTSFQSDKGSVASFKDAKNELDMKEDQHDTSKESTVFHDASTSNDHSNSADGKVETNTVSDTSTMLPDKTPHKPTKLQPSVQSSTPIVENVLAAKSSLSPLQIHDEQKEEEKPVEKGNEKETSPEKHSYITNDSNQNTDVDPLLFSPEKYLRSGKTYGNTPPNSAPRDSSKCSNKAADLETIPVEKEETSIQAEKTEYTFNAQKPKSPRALIHDMDEAAKQNGISSIVEEVVLNKLVASAGENEKLYSFSKSWSQSVSGKVGETGCKIDAIEGPLLITAGKDAPEAIVKKKEIPPNFEIKRQSRYESDDEEQDGSMIADNQRQEEQVESEDEDYVDEEPYTKNPIIDDEAIEADADYCSGDSMDEEERREMEENEISESGESIGSEDTEEDAEVNDADDKSEDSFIASSEEEDLLEYSDDDEHLDIGRQGISKKNLLYKPCIDSDSADEQKYTNTGTPKSKEIDENKNENLPIETADKAEEEVGQMPLSLEVSKMIDESITDEEMLGKSEKRWSSANGCRKIAAGEVMNEENKQQCYEALVSIANKYKTTLSEHESSNAVNEDKSIDSNEATTLSESALILRASSSENDSSEDGEKGEKRNGPRNKSLQEMNRSKRFSSKVKAQNDDEQQATEEGIVLSESALILRASTENDSSEDGENAQKRNASRNKSVKETNRSERFASKVIAQNDEQPLEKSNVSKSHGSPATEEEVIVADKRSDQADDISYTNSRNPSKEKGDVFEFNISGEITGNISTSKERQSLKSAKGTGLELRKSLNKSFTNDKSLNGSLKQRRSPKGTILGNSSESDTDGENEKKRNTSNFTTHKHSNAFLRGKGKQVGQTPDTAEDADSEQELSENEVFTSEFKTSTSKSLNCSILAATNNASESESPEEEEDMSDHNNADEVESEADEAANRDENKTEDTSDSCDVDENDVVEQLRGTDTNGSANPENKRGLSSVDKQQLEKVKCQTKLSASFSEHLARRQTLGLPGMAGTDGGAEKRYMSKSFCSSLDTTLPKMAKSETTNDLAAASPPHRSTPLAKSAIDETTNNIERIFKRCEEIIEAANRYKLNAKINFKKSKITLNKKQQQQAVAVGSDSEASKLTSEAVVVNQSLDRKRKEKTKSAVEQALKASANILLNPPYKKKHTKLPKLDEQNLESKRLPTQLLEALSNNAEVPNKKRKVHHKEQENQDESHKIKSAVGYITEFPLSPKEKKKKKTIKLATGTVCVEPLTPKKKDNISGFRECPLTPHTTGFKVRQILTAGQDTPPEYAASSSLTRKRKRIMVEPTHTLPKPQWTQSGFFLEQKILPSRIVSTHSSTTQFIVSALNETRKTTNKDISASALKFKQNSISHSKAARETSREVLLRKERQYVNNHY